ncbi:MAG: hypothetical protein IKZ49_01465, partial [Alphaproteobacteria bacterium]|nr:hypothetical protein [Alphaproteobacteria bacterium]
GVASCKTYYGDPSTCVLDNSNACEITGLTCESGYTSTTWGEWLQANINLMSQYLGRAVGCDLDGFGYYCDHGYEPGEFKVLYDEPINGFNGLTYIMACSDISADANNVNTMLSSKDSMTQGQATGKYCWLRINKVDNIETKTTQWFFMSEHESAQECAENCGDMSYVQNPTNYITAIAMSMANERFCAANAITINWTDADSEDISANNAGSTFYGGNVRTPVKAATKPGQRFKGWRFVAPTPVQVGE